MGVMLYRAGSSEKVWGYDVDLIVVDDAEVESHIKSGWFKSPELTAKKQENKADTNDDGKISVEEAKAYLDDAGVSYEGLHWKKIVALATEHMAA